MYQFLQTPHYHYLHHCQCQSCGWNWCHFAYRTSMLCWKYWFGPAAWKLSTLPLMQALHRNLYSLINTSLGLLSSNKHTQSLFLKVRAWVMIFQKKGKEMLKKRKIFENFGKNVQNLKIFWKRAGDCVW